MWSYPARGDIVLAVQGQRIVNLGAIDKVFDAKSVAIAGERHSDLRWIADAGTYCVWAIPNIDITPE